MEAVAAKGFPCQNDDSTMTFSTESVENSVNFFVANRQTACQWRKSTDCLFFDQ
jgi:hypothetical protein